MGATKEEGEVLGTLGMLMVMQKRYDEADDYFNKAKELYKKTGQRQGCGEIINQEALAALIRQDYGAARKLAKQALHIHEEERNTAGQGFSLELIGSAYSREKKWKQVIRHARQAQELYAATNNNPARLEALYLEAQACFENNDDNEAETVLRKIINADKEQHSCFFVGNAYNLLGLIFMKKGDLRRAKGFFNNRWTVNCAATVPAALPSTMPISPCSSINEDKPSKRSKPWRLHWNTPRPSEKESYTAN